MGMERRQKLNLPQQIQLRKLISSSSLIFKPTKFSHFSHVQNIQWSTIAREARQWYMTRMRCIILHTIRDGQGKKIQKEFKNQWIGEPFFLLWVRVGVRHILGISCSFPVRSCQCASDDITIALRHFKPKVQTKTSVFRLFCVRILKITKKPALNSSQPQRQFSREASS